MVAPDTARNIVGILGNVTAFVLFLSPVPTFHKIWRKKAVEDFSPIPYMATFLNCMMWVLYGIPLVHPHSLLVVTINVTGLVLESLYLAFFLRFATPAARLKVFMCLAVEIMFMAAVVVGVLIGAHTCKERSLIVGVMCVIFTVGMYASPLTVMRNVIETKSVKYMPLPLSVAFLFNSVCWTLYAFIHFDIFIVIPNGLGMLLGAGQLVLYGCYYSSTPKEEPKSEIQLPKGGTVAPGTDGDLISISIRP